VTVRCPRPPRPLPVLSPNDLFTAQGYPIVRIYFSGPPHPQAWNDFRHFGPLSTMRFDHQPLPQRVHPTRAVMYAVPGGVAAPVDPLDVAVKEVFGETGVIQRFMGAPRLVTWTPARPLRLLDVSAGTWLARAGGNAALTSGPRGVARDWARAVWNDYREVDGIAWSSAPLPGGKSIVLFERAKTAVPAHPELHLDLAHPALLPALARIARTYGLTIL